MKAYIRFSRSLVCMHGNDEGEVVKIVQSEENATQMCLMVVRKTPPVCMDSIPGDDFR
jgi:hypothetical protein